MEAIRINTILNEEDFPLEELRAFYGKKAEVIVIVEEDKKNQVDISNSLSGILNKYADKEKIGMEKEILAQTFKEKHECD